MMELYLLPLAVVCHAGESLLDIASNVINHGCVARPHPEYHYSYDQQASALLYAPVHLDDQAPYQQRIQYLTLRLLQLLPDWVNSLVSRHNLDIAMIASSDAKTIVAQQFRVNSQSNNTSSLLKRCQQQVQLVIVVDSLIESECISALAQQRLVQTKHFPEGIAPSEAAIALLLSPELIHEQQRRCLLPASDNLASYSLDRQPNKIITHYSLRQQLFQWLNLQRQLALDNDIPLINIASATGDAGQCNFFLSLAASYFYARAQQLQCCIDLTEQPRMALIH